MFDQAFRSTSCHSDSSNMPRLLPNCSTDPLDSQHRPGSSCCQMRCSLRNRVYAQQRSRHYTIDRSGNKSSKLSKRWSMRRSSTRLTNIGSRRLDSRLYLLRSSCNRSNQERSVRPESSSPSHLDSRLRTDQRSRCHRHWSLRGSSGLGVL